MREADLSPADRSRADALRRDLAQLAGRPASEVGIVRSPYRACPLGAHVDHQLGAVTGMALDRALLLGFVPIDEPVLRVRSRQFPGEARISLDAGALAARQDWADYARGAVFALAQRHALARGAVMLVDGYESVEGLSSSAAVGVAYLLALEAASGLQATAIDNIRLDRVVENDFIGVNNGIMDQSVILLSRAGSLTFLDCRSEQSRLVPLGGGAEVWVAVLYSGLSTPLVRTDYNLRVEECRRAAALLLEAAGMPVPDDVRLRDVPPAAFDEHAGRLPADLRRRAAHFFGEQDRVHRGVDLWAEGDLEGFGRLVTESGRSSVENYECGNAYLRTAFRVLTDCPGVYGARFSGAGWRGCCIALVRPDCADRVAEQALPRYRAAHPDVADRAELYFCRPGDGASFLD